MSDNKVWVFLMPMWTVVLFMVFILFGGLGTHAHERDFTVTAGPHAFIQFGEEASGRVSWAAPSVVNVTVVGNGPTETTVGFNGQFTLAGDNVVTMFIDGPPVSVKVVANY